MHKCRDAGLQNEPAVAYSPIRPLAFGRHDAPTLATVHFRNRAGLQDRTMRKSLLSSVAESSRRASPEAAPAAPTAEAPAAVKASSRAGLKHIGAYLDDDTVEKVAILRARLKLDNSQLVKLAIEDLFAKRRAEGAFKA